MRSLAKQNSKFPMRNCFQSLQNLGCIIIKLNICLIHQTIFSTDPFSKASSRFGVDRDLQPTRTDGNG